jgi:hypothetical protein
MQQEEAPGYETILPGCPKELRQVSTAGAGETMGDATGVVEIIVKMLVGQGLSGLIILTLGFAVWKLYDRNQALHTTLYEVGREGVKANEATAAALNRLADLLIRGRTPE